MESRYSHRRGNEGPFFGPSHAFVCFVLCLLFMAFIFETLKADRCDKRGGVYVFRIHQCLTGEVLK
jgi:hypothetical protein